MDPEVIVGQIKWSPLGMPGGWHIIENRPDLNPKRITMSEACAEMAAYWNCTPENARESLLKHGYASSPKRDWRVAGRGFDESDSW